MEVEKASAGFISLPLAGGRNSEREVILAQGLRPNERYSGCGMDSACLGPDDCAGQADIETREYQTHTSLAISACHRRTDAIGKPYQVRS